MNKDDYRAVVEECLDIYEESFTDMDVLYPYERFECESKDAFGEFLINRGIFRSKEEYDKACDSNEIHYINDLWSVLDLVYDLFDIDCIELLCDYAEMHEDFMRASYNRGRDYIEDIDYNED